MKANRVCAMLGAVASAAVLTVSTMPASAADFGYGSVKDIPVAPVASGRTWYLRGTIGMKNPEVGSIFVDEPEWANHTVHHEDIKSTALFGFGIGVEANRWLRFDITGEYRGKQHFVAHDSYSYGDCAVDPDDCGTNDYSANLKSWMGLANAYIDLGTFRGITPYVGGGIGFASITTMGFKDQNVPQNSTFYADRDKTTTNFAWALYAGMSYDVTPAVTLDFGYRYTDLGSVKTGRATAYDGSASYSGLEIRDITSHDLLFTARYRLGSHEPMYPVAIK